MSALKLCKRAKGLDTGNKEQALMHTQKHAVCVNIEVQDVSLCLSMFKESVCAGDADVALWELCNECVKTFWLKQQPNDPS